MKIMHLNCQGMGDQLTTQYLKDIRRSFQPDIMILIETKQDYDAVEKVCKDLNYASSFIIPAIGLSGGLAIFWDGHVQLSLESRPSLYKNDMYIVDGKNTFCLTYIYGHPTVKPRNQQWEDMILEFQSGAYSQIPRVVIGDFNDVKYSYEKDGGPSKSDGACGKFRRMLSICGLHDIKTVGGCFTRVGKRRIRTVRTRIDRAVATCDWLDIYPSALVQVLPWQCSDHRALLLHTTTDKWKGKKLFRYDPRWGFDPAFQEHVSKIWSDECQNVAPENFSKALELCRKGLSRWRTQNVTNARRQIKRLKELIQDIYRMPNIDYQLLHDVKAHLTYANRMEEEYWRTKSRICWLKAGYKNMKYFHAKTKQRRAYNRILSLTKADGSILMAHEDINNHIIDYFTDLFTSNCHPDTIPFLQDMQPRVTESMNNSLTQAVTELEIYQALQQMNPDKAPGPDGLTVAFYKDHWSTVKDSLLNLITHFFTTAELDPALNHTHICLIPKIENPIDVKDFRPISLSNVAYKVLSKVLANRLKSILHYIISDNQSAFIPNRLITDNVLIAQEMLHSLKTRKLKTHHMALKLDISKAFDKVEWCFLEQMMRRMGFTEVWCKWIMKCVTSVTYSVLVNGTPTMTIKPSRGIRQGDPLSPYLYLICTEALSFLLTKAKEEGHISGFQVAKGGPIITHLLFADDSLLFTQATMQECEYLLSILRVYKEASGQEVNFSKSAITFSKGMDLELKQEIIQVTQIIKVGGFGRYLGLPENIGRNKMETFSYLVQRMYQKVDSRYSKLLSPAGKETLIKDVLMALPTYCMQCFMLPKNLLDKLTASIRRFFWSSSQEKAKINCLSWDRITLPKYLGGLGFRDLRDFNIALLAKQSWRLMQQPSSLLAKVYKAKYYPNTTLLEAKQKWSSSYAWRSILQGNKLIRQGVRWNIGDGESVYFWRDPWLPLSPSTAPLPCDDNINSELKVKDLFLAGTTIWDNDRLKSMVHPFDLDRINQVRTSVTGAQDAITWLYSAHGGYTVKSGYNYLRAQRGQSARMSFVRFKNLWQLKLPPKIHHFWWKVLNDALPVAIKLKHRKILSDSTCLVCGEMDESVNHLLFKCRISREIWELVFSVGLQHQSLLDDNANGNYAACTDFLKDSPDQILLFHFIGWRIWKQRNDLVFNSKRWPIPMIISKALLDYHLWQEAQVMDQQEQFRRSCVSSQDGDIPVTLCQLFDQIRHRCCCLIDASWLSANHNIGIGWSLHDNILRQTLCGFGSFPPTQSPIQAEVEALRMATMELHRLGYRDITLCGDSKAIYGFLQNSERNLEDPKVKNLSYLISLQDIIRIAKLCNFSFKCISRKVNTHADMLAKRARLHSQSYVIS